VKFERESNGILEYFQFHYVSHDSYLHPAHTFYEIHLTNPPFFKNMFVAQNL